jgi:hypothetical protein
MTDLPNEPADETPPRPPAPPIPLGYKPPLRPVGSLRADRAAARPTGWRRFSKAQRQLVGFILVIAIVDIAYRLVYATGFQRTAALYVGIPTLLAIGLALLPSSKSAIGTIMRGSTLAVMIACVILPEGLLCLIFVLPLIVIIGLIVGSSIDASRAKNRRKSRPLMLIGLPLLLLSSEGVVGSPINPHDAVKSSVVIQAKPADIAAALAKTPTFGAELPMFLTVGFNRPISASGSGLAVGDERTIEFTGGTHDDHPLRLFGLTGTRSVDHHSHMRLTITESTPGRVVFSIDHDTTMLERWADLDRAVVTWEPLDASHVRVTWRFEYQRLLSPTVYFGPLQRFGLSEAADYLLDTLVVSQVP